MKEKSAFGLPQLLSLSPAQNCSKLHMRLGGDPDPVPHRQRKTMAAATPSLSIFFFVCFFTEIHHTCGTQEPEKVTFGEKGSGPGQFDGPWGVAVSDEGEIFVTDLGNQRIQVFTLQGTFVRQFPTVVSGEQKIYPHDVVIDREGNLWTVGWTDSADHDEFAVQYDKQGSLLRKFELQNTIRMCRRALAVDTWWNHIFITQVTGDKDNPQGEVLVFRTNGTLVRTMGLERGPKEPGHITVDGDGLLLASGISDDQVYVYNYMFGDLDDFLFRFGGSETWNGDDLRLLNVPCGICVAGVHIIVADRGNGRVEMFTLREARFVKHIATDMKAPWSVAVATQGHQLVVTDYYDNKITIFPESVWLWS